MPLDGWPTRAGAERSARLITEIDRGNFEHQWCPLELSDGGPTLRLLVSCDSLQVDGIRVTAGPVTQQIIADKLDAVLLTPKLYDELYLHALPQNRVDPLPQGEPRTSTQTMIRYSSLIDEQLARRGGGNGQVANQNKIWAIANAAFTHAAKQRHAAANYGWIIAPDSAYAGQREASQSTPSLQVIQDISTFHPYLAWDNALRRLVPAEDSDYSQGMLFVHRSARFGELPVDVARVYVGDDPGNSLVSHEGPLLDWRYPTGDAPPSAPGDTPTPMPTLGSAPRGGGGVGGPIIAGAVLGGLGYAVAGGPAGIAAGLFGLALGAVLRR